MLAGTEGLPMKWVPGSVLLILSLTDAHAQSAVTQKLLVLDQATQMAAWTKFLNASN
jgi:hypothetical protein